MSSHFSSLMKRFTRHGLTCIRRRVGARTLTWSLSPYLYPNMSEVRTRMVCSCMAFACPENNKNEAVNVVILWRTSDNRQMLIWRSLSPWIPETSGRPVHILIYVELKESNIALSPSRKVFLSPSQITNLDL